jgi:hypothetical protein
MSLTQVVLINAGQPELPLFDLGRNRTLRLAFLVSQNGEDQPVTICPSLRSAKGAHSKLAGRVFPLCGE